MKLFLHKQAGKKTQQETACTVTPSREHLSRLGALLLWKALFDESLYQSIFDLRPATRPSDLAGQSILSNDSRAVLKMSTWIVGVPAEVRRRRLLHPLVGPRLPFTGKQAAKPERLGLAPARQVCRRHATGGRRRRKSRRRKRGGKSGEVTRASWMRPRDGQLQGSTRQGGG